MGRSYILEEVTHKQLDRILLKLPHAKIQRLLLGGYHVCGVDALLSQITLKKGKARYGGPYKEIVVYPHFIVNVSTYLKQTEASCEDRATLERHNAARVVKALRNPNMKTKTDGDRIVAYIQKIDPDAVKKKFDRWRRQVSAERSEAKKTYKSPNTMIQRVQGASVTKCPPPGHIFCLIAPTKKSRKVIREGLGSGKYVFATSDATTRIQDLPTEALEIVHQRLKWNEDNDKDRYSAQRNHKLDKTPTKNLIIFSKTIKAGEELMRTARWKYTRKGYSGSVQSYESYLWLRNLDSSWRSTNSGGVLEVK